MNLKEIEDKCERAKVTWYNEIGIIDHTAVKMIQEDLPECIRLLREARELLNVAVVSAEFESQDEQAAMMRKWLSEVKDGNA